MDHRLDRGAGRRLHGVALAARRAAQKAGSGAPRHGAECGVWQWRRRWLQQLRGMFVVCRSQCDGAPCRGPRAVLMALYTGRSHLPPLWRQIGVRVEA